MKPTSAHQFTTILAVAALMLSGSASADRWSEAQTNKNSYAARQEYLNKHSWTAYNSRNNLDRQEMWDLRKNSLNYQPGHRIEDLRAFMRDDPQGFCNFMYKSAYDEIGTPEAIFNAVNGNSRTCHGDWYLMLANLYFSGVGTDVDKVKAVEAYKDWAWQEGSGKADAMADVAAFYMKGQFVAQDQKEGLYWLKKAADANHIASASHLAGAYYHGTYEELPADQELAVKYARLAADAGNSDSQYLLGLFYMSGDGVEKDAAKGQELLKQAAKAGQLEAQNALKAAKVKWK